VSAIFKFRMYKTTSFNRRRGNL